MLIPNWVKVLAMVALFGLAFAAGWVVRGWRADAVESKAVTVQATKAVTTARRQAAVTAGVDASGAAREQKQTVVYKTIHDQVIHYVEKKSDSSAAACVLDTEWVRLHNAAATGKLPDASGAGYATSAETDGDQ